MYCHEKYNCRALGAAAKDYIAWAERMLQTSIPVKDLISGFKASARFGLTESYETFGKFLARNLRNLSDGGAVSMLAP